MFAFLKKIFTKYPIRIEKTPEMKDIVGDLDIYIIKNSTLRKHNLGSLHKMLFFGCLNECPPEKDKIGPGGKYIVVNEFFDQYPDRIKLAILAHEMGHLELGHLDLLKKKKIFYNLPYEFLADEYAFNLGFGSEIKEILLQYLPFSLDAELRLENIENLMKIGEKNEH